MCMLRDIRFMRDEDNGVALTVQVFEQSHNFFAGPTIEISCRLIREENGRLRDKRPCHGNALTLSAG